MGPGSGQNMAAEKTSLSLKTRTLVLSFLVTVFKEVKKTNAIIYL
jgi:hypothetical protein